MQADAGKLIINTGRNVINLKYIIDYLITGETRRACCCPFNCLLYVCCAAVCLLYLLHSLSHLHETNASVDDAADAAPAADVGVCPPPKQNYGYLIRS